MRKWADADNISDFLNSKINIFHPLIDKYFGLDIFSVSCIL